MSILEGFKTITKTLRAASATIRDEIEGLRARITAGRRALEQARNGLVPPDELPARIAEIVGAAGEFWRRNHGPVVHYLGKPAGVASPWGSEEPMSFGALCALAPGMMQEGLQRLAAAEAYEAGPSTSERAAVVARLEAELADLEAAEEALVDGAAEQGVTIAHRPDVVQRRATEARQREFAAARAEELRLQEEARRLRAADTPEVTGRRSTVVRGL